MSNMGGLTHAEYGEFGKLFAQIQADSEIEGGFFEGNITSDVIAAMKHYLLNLPDNPLQDFIDNQAYQEELRKVINRDFTVNILDIYPTSSAVAPIYSKIMEFPNVVAVPCGIQKHAIVIEFVLEDNYLGINIYNTGLGVDKHESQFAEGTMRYRCCKRHRIDLGSIAKDEREVAIKNIIDMTLPQGVAKEQLNDQIDSLYKILEDLVLIHPGSTIDNNDASLIIGQRSGTCAWKSIFKYVREKVKKITKNDDLDLLLKNDDLDLLLKNDDLDLLLKYDIKLRNMQEFMKILRYYPNKTKITKELIRAIIFSCQNNARLSIKIHSKGLITDANLAKALELYEQMYSLLPELNKRLIKNKHVNMPEQEAHIEAPAITTLSETTEQYLSDSVLMEIDFPVATVEDCVTQLRAVSEKISKGEIEQDKYLVLLCEYIVAKCADYLFDSEFDNIEKTLEIVRDLHVIADEYLKCAVKDKQQGFSEVRNLTLVTTALLAINLLTPTATATNVRTLCNAHPKFYLRKNISEILFKPLNDATTNRLVTDPNLAMQFNKIRDKIEELKAKYNENEVFLNFDSLKEGKLFAEAELYWWVLCLLEKSGVLANIELHKEPHDLFLFLSVQADGKSSSVISISDLEACMNSSHIDYQFVLKQYYHEFYGPTPVDRYTLGEISEVYSSGFIKYFKKLNKMKETSFNSDLRIDTSDFAYMPRGKQITHAEAIDNQLQIMFAEEGISLIRLKEFIFEKLHELNNAVYTDIILLRLFKSRAIEKQLTNNPKSVLEFLIFLKEVIDNSIERADSCSKNAIFPLLLYYQTSWHALSFFTKCKDPVLQSKIKDEIASANFLPLINAKLAAFDRAEDHGKEEYAQLLALKHLHFKILNTLEINLSNNQIAELLTASMSAGINAINLGRFGEMCEDVRSHILETIPADRLQDIAQTLAKNLVVMFNLEPKNICDINYEQQSHVLSFKLGSESVAYAFDSGVTVIGENQFTRIPYIFKNHPQFIASFDPIPTYCLVQSENQIKLEYRNRQYTINLQDSYMNMQIADMQLYQPNGNVNYYALKGLPLTMLDLNHEIFFKADGSVEILDKATKITAYTLDVNLTNIKRTSDSADLILEPSDPVYATFANFEHSKFIEIWQLADGTRELVLPRYNIVLRYDPNNQLQITMLLPQQAEFSLLSDAVFSQMMPNAVLLLDANGQQRSLLPEQFYMSQNRTIKFDTLAISKIAENGTKHDLYKPQLNSYRRSEKFISFAYDANKSQCATGDDYFSLAYYLLGQDEYALSKQYLYQGIAACTTHNARYTWLKNMINFVPKTANENAAGNNEHEMEDAKINLYGTCHVAIRVQALYFYCCETDLVDLKDKNFEKEAVELLVRYYGNLNNIPNQFHLTYAQELKLLSFFDGFKHEKPKILGGRNELVKAIYNKTVSYSLETEQKQPNLQNVVLEIKLQHPSEIILAPIPLSTYGSGRFKTIMEKPRARIDFPEDFVTFYFSILESKKHSYEAMEIKALLLNFILMEDKSLDSKLLAKWLLYILEVAVESPNHSIVFPDDLSKYHKKVKWNIMLNLKEFLSQVIPNVPEAYTIAAVKVQNETKYLPASVYPTPTATMSPMSVDLRSLFEQMQMRLLNKETSMNLQILQMTTDILASKIVRLFNIRPDVLSKAATLAAKKPELTLEQIMQIFVQQDLGIFQRSSYMTADQCAEVNKLIFEYLLQFTQTQRVQRNELHLPRGYSATDESRLLAVCLLFEKEAAIGMYPLQVDNIKHILDNQYNPNAIVQMAMGQGKTKVMSPIIAIANANGDNLSIYVTPQSLYNTTLVNMSVVTQRIFNKTPIGINFERKDLNIRSLTKIWQNLQTARLERTFIIMSPETVHALYLSRIECAIDGNIECKRILDEIMQLFKEHGVCTIDEIDQVLNLQTENNYASLMAKSLEQKFPTMISAIMDFYTQLHDVVLPYDEEKTFLDLITGLARKPKDDAEWSNLSISLADAIYNAKFKDLDVNKEDIIACLLAKKDIASLPDSISEQTKDILALLKFEISELFRITINSPYIEKYAASKRHAQQFADILAIPHSMSLPIKDAEFSDPVTTINYTIQSFMHNSTLVTSDLLHKFRTDVLQKYGLLRSQEMRNEYLAWLAELLQIEDKSNFKLPYLMDEEFIARLAMQSARNVKFKNYLLRNYILPEIIENDFELQSRAYTFNYTFKHVSGFSGTLENPNMFHDSMQLANRAQGLAIDQAILNRLDEISPQVTTASAGLTVQEQLQKMIAKNVVQDNNLHAIIDVGAVFKTMGSNLAAAEFIATNLSDPITHVLYFQGNDLWALSVTTKASLHIPNTSPEKIREITGASPDTYFTFYDQAHTTGIDIKHAANAHAILTLGEDNLTRDFLQGAMRMRGLKEGGRQTIEVFVTAAATQRQPQLGNWTWHDVVSFMSNNSLNATLEMNFRAAQLLMSQYFQNQINDLALAAERSPDEYVDKLKATKVDSLFKRYGILPQEIAVEEALLIFRDVLLDQAAQYPQINIDDFRKYCDKIIDRYKGICKAEVKTALTAMQANTTSFVARQQQLQGEQQQNKDNFDEQHGVKAETMFKKKYKTQVRTLMEYLGRNLMQNALSLNDLTWDVNKAVFAVSCYLDLADPYKCRNPSITANLSAPFNDPEQDKHIYCWPEDFTSFYSTDDAVAEELKTVTKNAYYIAVLERPNLSPLHFLLSEEAKDKIENELSGFDSHSHQWTDSLPIGCSLAIFTKHNNLEFSTTQEEITLDPGVLLRMHMFNADIHLLLDMLNGKNTAIVKYFFATQTQEKLKYLSDKVKVFRRDQSIHFMEFEKRINEIIVAKPAPIIFTPKSDSAQFLNPEPGAQSQSDNDAPKI